MQYRPLGTTDLHVSELCFGTMRYASKSGELDEAGKAGRRALEEAIDAGVNFIHSSYEYRTRWLTEQTLASHPKRHELHHIIKVNVPDWDEERFDEEKFREQIHTALKELHTDRIAVIQHLHRGTLPRRLGYSGEGEPKRVSEFEAVTHPLVKAFERLQKEGKVGHLISFPYTVGYARRVIESGLFAGLAAFFNPLETEMMDLFPALEEKGMGFIAIRPLAAGLLTNGRVSRSALPDGDPRHEPSWDRFYDQLDVLRRRMEEDPADWSSFAIRFSISSPVITSSVLGINRPDQLQSALSALDGPAIGTDVQEVASSLTEEFRRKFGVRGLPSGIPVYEKDEPAQ
jgi:aryl-alcohol dehydrogenase-like predicted oxidoreductase